MQTVTVTAKEVEVKGPFKTKDGKREYNTIKISAKEGTFQGFFNEAKDELPESGSLINIAFEENGKYKNIKKYEILDVGETEVKAIEAKLSAGGFNVGGGRTERATASKVPEVKSLLLNKDISMEVSGLLQALISTGKYTINDSNIDGSLLDVEVLESHLRLALDLKRRVAADLEAGKL